MIVEVRGTRSGSETEDPAERYRLKSDPARSRTPLAFGVALVAIALYLKSLFRDVDPVGIATEPGGDPAPEPTAPADEAVAATLRPRPEAPIPADPPDESAGQPDGAGDLPRSIAFMDGSGTVRSLVSFEQGWTLPHPANGVPSVPGFPRQGTPAPVDGLPGSPGSSHGSGSPNGPARPRDDDGKGPRAADPGGRPRDPGPPRDGGPGAPGPGTGGGGGGPREPDEGDDEDPERANRAPRVSGAVLLGDITACGLLSIALGDLLANASDPDGDALSVRNLGVSGGLLVEQNAGWLYRPAGVDFGPVTISYQISDGMLAVNQTATLSVVRPAPIVGSDGDDLLIGSTCADEIDGRAGDDNIDARSGEDVIFGGAGDDHIVAGAGNDTVWGGAGRDIVFGGDGDDHIFGGAGNDRLHGDDGNDVVQGGEGDDVIFGGAGDDVLSGGAGRDVLYDGAGKDVVSGDAGDDRIAAAADGAADVFDGGDGDDLIDFSAAAGQVSVDLAAGAAFSPSTGGDTLRGFETVIGGSDADLLRGSELAEVLIGALGADGLFGLGGDDTLVGGVGDDVLSGGEGNDRLFGNEGDDRILDGAGADTVDGGAGDDHVAAALDGAHDVYDGGGGRDTLDYSAATRALIVDLTTGAAVGIEIGEDTISSFELVLGGEGDDHFIAAPGSVGLAGGGGQNLFEFRAWEGLTGLSEALHEILDFKQGDRIRLSKYDLFERAVEAFEDRFDAVYVGSDESRAWIRYRHDEIDMKSLTRVEADLDRDDVFETTILVTGHHMLAFVENV